MPGKACFQATSISLRPEPFNYREKTETQVSDIDLSRELLISDLVIIIKSERSCQPRQASSAKPFTE